MEGDSFRRIKEGRQERNMKRGFSMTVIMRVCHTHVPLKELR